MILADSHLASGPLFARFGRILVHVPHEPRRLVEIGLCPLQAGWIWPRGLARLSKRERDEVGVVAVHELQIAGVAGCDHWLAQRHRLRHRQAESLAPMQ